jgi:NAD(P)-dependent dehydrogenase (short-subunit alcohol dehydrogenase family)
MQTMVNLKGQVAVVTGGSRGLGRSMVIGFARAGADVVVASRKLAACEAVAGDVEALGSRCLPLSFHAGDWPGMEGFVERIYETFGRIDVLVNNAGLSPIAPSSVETSESLFDKILDVNFKGPFRLTALVGSRMAKAGRGAVINISSAGALRPSPWIGPYAGAKAALNAASVAFSQEFGPYGVRVNVISPGPFLTDIAKAWADDDLLRDSVALRRFGHPDEIVSTALYLATASFTNGANIVVDGGGPVRPLRATAEHDALRIGALSGSS